MCIKLNFLRPFILFVLAISANLYPTLGQSEIKFSPVSDFNHSKVLNEVLNNYKIYSLDLSKALNNDSTSRQNTQSFSVKIQNEQFEFILEEVNLFKNASFYTLNELGKNIINLIQT
ncbi:MAG: hypothetical protein IPO48_06430 [Saprospiraceae bacterium]|nr:hypothetical protein [Saprospiraceae bacterium]